MSKTEAMILNLSQQMQEGFGKIGEQFEKIDERFDRIDDRFDQMDKRMNKMDEMTALNIPMRVEKLERDVKELQACSA